MHSSVRAFYNGAGMMMRKLIALFQKGLRPHFGQSAEDILIRHYLRSHETGTYLDLGAYDPFIMSNTALLWTRGWRGCNVDANYSSIKKFKKYRPIDLNLHAAVVTKAEKRASDTVKFFVDGSDSKSRSARGSLYKSSRSNSEILVPCRSIIDIVDACNFTELNFLNVDLEGHDFKIISEFPFEQLAPDVISIEDVGKTALEAVNSQIGQFLALKGYNLVARTYLTSIFVKGDELVRSRCHLTDAT